MVAGGVAVVAAGLAGVLVAEVAIGIPFPFVMDAGGRVASSKEPRRLPSPFAEGLSAKSQEGQIIERLMRGEADHLVADDLGEQLGALVRLKAKARREGGLVFPGDEAKPKGDARPWKPSKPKGKSGAVKGKALDLPRMPIPPPPYWWEDPKSEVWTNPRLLPTYAESSKGSMAAVGPHDYRGYRTMSDAAARHNMTLGDYIRQRIEMVRRVEAGEKPTEVALDMRVSTYAVYSILSDVGRGRMVTLNARPLEAREPEPVGPDVREPKPAPAARRATPRRAPEAAERTAAAVRAIAAEKWGFANVAAYQQMREQVRDLRLGSVGPDEIARRLDMPRLFVKTTLQSWRREHGVEFPVLVLHRETKAA